MDKTPFFIINGHLWIPFFIFIENARYPDEHLLGCFDSKAGLLSDLSEKPAWRYVMMSNHNDGSWSMVADCWFYSLWHRPATFDSIERLAREHNIFTCWLGDTDLSFGFTLYQNGQLVRKFVVNDSQRTGGTIREDFGTPMQAEAEAFKHHCRVGDTFKMRLSNCPKDADRSQALEHRAWADSDLVLNLATSLGIDMSQMIDNMRVHGPQPCRRKRCYCKPPCQNEGTI